MAPECAACGASVKKRDPVCNECGNSPRRDLGLSLVVIALAIAVGSIFFPPAIVLSFLLLFVAGTAYLTARWGYPARKYDFRFGIGFEPSGPADVEEEQSAD